MNRLIADLGLLMLGLLPSAALLHQVPGNPKSSLALKIDAVLQQPEFKSAHWGILVVDQADGRVVYEKNADELFAPASVTKLYSVAAALDAFGADYRFVTKVVRKGELRSEGLLDGDLILIASGDLTMGGRTDANGKIAFKNVDHTYAAFTAEAETTEQNPLAGLADLARQIAAAGIKRVRGDVLIDDRLFEKSESTGSGPTRLSPIVVNDNVIDFHFTPTEPGKPATVQWRPRTASLVVDAQVMTGPENSVLRTVSHMPGPGRVVVRGSIPAKRKMLTRIAEVEDPASFARSLFIDSLRAAGISVEASSLERNRSEGLPARDTVAELPQVASFISPPFSEEARLILKVSHNLHASTLPLLIAAKNGQRTLEQGLLREGAFLRRAKVDVDQISFGGGAGGARNDFATPRATIQLLRYMATRPDFAVYEGALPILGVDGTTHDSVPEDSPARGKVRAKTGTFVLTNQLNGRAVLISKALAGYVTSASGKKLAFAMFVNGTHLPNTGETKREGKTLGKLAEIIYHED